MNWFSRILLILVVTGLAACGSGDRGANAVTNTVVLEKTDALMKAMQNQDYQKAVQLYSDEFFSRTSPEGWAETLKLHIKDRGAMRSYELKKSQADTRFSGKFYILEYMAVYEGAKRANHIITLLAPVDSSGIKIVGHKISPWLDVSEK